MPVPSRPDLLAEKPACYDKHFKTMSDAAERMRAETAGGGAKAFTPKDLELFEANDHMKMSCYRRSTCTTRSPTHTPYAFGFKAVRTRPRNAARRAWDVPAWRLAKFMAKVDTF